MPQPGLDTDQTLTTSLPLGAGVTSNVPDAASNGTTKDCPLTLTRMGPAERLLIATVAVVGTAVVGGVVGGAKTVVVGAVVSVVTGWSEPPDRTVVGGAVVDAAVGCAAMVVAVAVGTAAGGIEASSVAGRDESPAETNPAATLAVPLALGLSVVTIRDLFPPWAADATTATTATTNRRLSKPANSNREGFRRLHSGAVITVLVPTRLMPRMPYGDHGENRAGRAMV